MGQRTISWTVPVSRNYNVFMREVQQRVARYVASRTLGPDGRPLRREIALTQGNQSLLETHTILVTRGMQQATIRACFHTSDTGRVERITFSPPPVIPVAPTTIIGSPPRPQQRTPTPRPNTSAAPPGQRPGREQESVGEVGGAPGMLSGGRMFYGIHTTRHDTMCYGAYDNASDHCYGVETENTMVYRLHFDQGLRDYEYLMTRLGKDIVMTQGYQTRLRNFVQRVEAGRSEGARRADRIYREGAREGHRRLRTRYPNLPNVA